MTSPDDESGLPPADTGAEGMRELFDRSFHRMAASLAARAREIDDRAAAHMLALDYDRATLPDELRQSIAGVLPAMVADAVRVASDARPAPVPPPPPPRAQPEERGERGDPEPREPREAREARDAPRLPTEHDPILEARQRSLEKRLDGLTRRSQEIDDRVTAHLRRIDDDRAVLADLVRNQDALARSLDEADVAGHHDRLAAWVMGSVPGLVAAAVEAALEAQASVFSDAVDRAERARADTEATKGAVQESSERLLEVLYRREQETDEKAAAQVQALEAERAALAALLADGGERIARSVATGVPGMVDRAVRNAMERYTTERRVPLQEMTSRLRADVDVMRDGLQRSFEKMMEALALREQELDERAAAHVRSLHVEREALAALRIELSGSLHEALPGLVAEAVRSTATFQHAELDEVRAGTNRLRVEGEATAAELRGALAEMKATLAGRDETVERQSAAYERALDGLRSAMARRAVLPAREGAAAPAPSLSPGAQAATVADETNGGRAASGRSSVPRARRVERRMLKIDDGDEGDEGPWPALDRRQSALSELLDGADG